MARLGVGCLDGPRPHIVTFMRNWKSDEKSNRNHAAWAVDGSSITDNQNAGGGSDEHSTRIIDVGGDGKGEVDEIMFMLKGNGTFRQDMTISGVDHAGV
jgi:hypothetical protein